MPGWLSDLLGRLAGEPWLQGVLAALATFVLEDPTTIGCGLLVAAGRMGFWTAFLGVSAGIAIGDVGLYGAGRFAGPAVARSRWVSAARLERAEAWFRRNVVLAVVLSRFVPGMRLPTYVAAGLLRAPFIRFTAVAVAASVVWTALLLRVTVSVGEAILPWIGRWKWPVAAVAILLLVLLQRGAARAIERGGDRVTSRFEFWSPWLFYVPVALWWTVLAARYRSWLLPTLANPTIHAGGLIGESKSAILDLVSGPARERVAAWTTFDRPGQGAPLEAVVDRAVRSIREAGLDFPLVAKPDVGQRGAGVWPLSGTDELREYLRQFPEGERVVLQRMAGAGARRDDGVRERLRGVREAGVLWWKRPGETRGRIFSITLKRFPVLVGDGRRTVSALLDADPRAGRIRDVYARRLEGELARVPGAGERVPLVFSGNHCQGAIFLDGTDLANEALLDAIEEVASSMPEFHFGRFDVRFDDVEAFFRGEDLQIVEINGAGAEATHIWDARARLREAYATLFRQFAILFAIGDEVRRRGRRPMRLRDFIRETLDYRRVKRSYPLTR